VRSAGGSPTYRRGQGQKRGKNDDLRARGKLMPSPVRKGKEGVASCDRTDRGGEIERKKKKKLPAAETGKRNSRFIKGRGYCLREGVTKKKKKKKKKPGRTGRKLRSAPPKGEHRDWTAKRKDFQSRTRCSHGRKKGGEGGVSGNRPEKK